MQLARVIGTVVATKKEEAMKGRKLLLLRPLAVDDSDPPKLKEGAGTVVATDSLGAGPGETVLFCQGSSARQAEGMQTAPVDSVVIGIVDQIEAHRHRLLSAKP